MVSLDNCLHVVFHRLLPQEKQVDNGVRKFFTFLSVKETEETDSC